MVYIDRGSELYALKNNGTRAHICTKKNLKYAMQYAICNGN